MLLTMFVIALVLIILIIFIQRPYKYWSDRGVKQGKPVFPFGDIIYTITRTQSFAEMLEMVYNYGSPDCRYSGMYQFLTPIFFVRDPDLIKQLTVKDFDHFLDHRNLIADDIDPLWAGNLIGLSGQKWKDMRSTLSPSFTSNKMKYMFHLISDNAREFVQHFLEKDQDEIEAEMKDVISRYTNDVIANTVFGVECNSLSEENNEFFIMGTHITNLTGILRNIKFLGGLLFPKLYKVFKIQLYAKEVSTFFLQLVKSNLAIRKQQSIVRPDMINILLEARNTNLKQEEASHEQIDGFSISQNRPDWNKTNEKKRIITDSDITSQVMFFLIAGYGTTSSHMAWLCYELGANPDIQARLIEEIDETSKKCNGEVTYEAVLGMKYMDMVVSETLRKWPNGVLADRVCTKPYTIPPKYPFEKAVHLRKGDILCIPIYAIHRDPKYYPDPLRFDPERFNDKNRINIKPCTYMPFGYGPRNCIGSRFALLETKILFFHILSNFEIVPTAKTRIPARPSKKHGNLLAEDGFWFGLKNRARAATA